MEFIENESRRIYQSRINMVQDYIENHLEEELNVSLLAGVAAFSEFHFQRIYRQMTGESLYSFIKRLRLEKSVFLLRTNHKLTVQDVALSVGFSNQASFAKALKERYRLTASAIRKMDQAFIPDLLSQGSRNGKVFNLNPCYNEPSELAIMHKDSINVLYVRYTGSYKGNSDLFMKLFTKLYDYAAGKNLLTKNAKWISVYHDFGSLTEDEKLRLSVCMSIPQKVDNDGEFGCMELDGGQYAVGRFSLSTHEYQGAWDYMLTKWLPESGYMPRDSFSFEYYPPQKYNENDTRRIVEICIPITPL